MFRRAEILCLCAGTAVFGLLFAACARSAPAVRYETLSRSEAKDRERLRLANEAGLHCAHRHEWSAAEEQFHIVLAIDPLHAGAHNNLGLVYLQQRRVYEAAVELTLATKHAPRSLEPVMNLGRLYDSIGWRKEAATQYERALALDPACMEAVGQLARCYIELRRDRSQIDPLLTTLASQEEHAAWRAWGIKQRSDTPP